MATTVCPLCGSVHSETVYRAAGVPFANVDRALDDFTVALCLDCGFAYQASAYAPAYDDACRDVYADYVVNRQFPFPERSDKHLTALADVLPHIPVAAPCDVLEIGSNRGDFLYLLKEARPQVNALGIEPTRFADPLMVPTLTTPFRAGLFSNAFQLIVAKHVIEHIKHPAAFLRELRDGLAEGGLLYLEVPDLDRSLDNGIEDFIPDHVSYFDRDTLVAALDGFDVVLCEVRNFLHVLARRRSGATTPAAAVPPARRRAGFAAFRARKDELTARLRAHALGGGRIVFYGAGFYFARIYKELADVLPPGRAAFRDDNIPGDVEPTFGLPRAAAIADDDMVLICANNAAVQARIERRLAAEGTTAPTVHPWRMLRRPQPEPKTA